MIIAVVAILIATVAYMIQLIRRQKSVMVLNVLEAFGPSSATYTREHLRLMFFVEPPNVNAVWMELRVLEMRGLVQRVDDGRAERRETWMYGITQAGQEKLEEWTDK